MKLLLTAATEGEIGPFLGHLQQNATVAGPGRFTLGQNDLQVCISGVGMLATAYNLAKLLQANSFDFAIQAGVGGSYDPGITLGDTLFVSSDQYGDLGAQDHYNYLDIFELGLLEEDGVPFTSGKLVPPPHPLHNKIKLSKATALTVNTVAGADFMVKARRQKFNCQLESMEGAAFHYVCLQENIPFAQVRAISNYVEPRDKSKWKMKEAINNLNNWLIDFLEQL
ncbi:MAG: futalosine hydrolase [Bacteroidetes bacterium 46-16]|nr:MAG: futalosine hydrolase [Bacteroidetes bacterium 46-16]